MFASSWLIYAPSLPATTLAPYCYRGMFYSTPLSTLPALPATNPATSCYNNMFRYCSNIKISKTQEWEYQNEFRLNLTSWYDDTYEMISDTWWTYDWERYSWKVPVNTTYYTSNTVV
jgi:hypothetical protein